MKRTNLREFIISIMIILWTVICGIKVYENYILTILRNTHTCPSTSLNCSSRPGSFNKIDGERDFFL